MFGSAVLKRADVQGAKELELRPRGLAYIFQYHVDRFPFYSRVAEALGVPPNGLDKLHHTPLVQVDRCHIGISAAQCSFYRSFGTGLRMMYSDFLRSHIVPILGEDLVVQRTPTLRVRPPGQPPSEPIHRDSQFGHQPDIINFWLPLTISSSSAALHLNRGDVGPTVVNRASCSDCDDDQLFPVEMRVGEVLRFDAINICHGNLQSNEDVTRVSFDFRVVRTNDFRDSDEVSRSARVRLSLGDYYTLLDNVNDL